MAAENGHLEVVKVLLKKEIEIGQGNLASCIEPYRYAVKNDHYCISIYIRSEILGSFKTITHQHFEALDEELDDMLHWCFDRI